MTAGLCLLFALTAPVALRAQSAPPLERLADCRPSTPSSSSPTICDVDELYELQADPHETRILVASAALDPAGRAVIA